MRLRSILKSTCMVTILLGVAGSAGAQPSGRSFTSSGQCSSNDCNGATTAANSASLDACSKAGCTGCTAANAVVNGGLVSVTTSGMCPAGTAGGASSTPTLPLQQNAQLDPQAQSDAADGMIGAMMQGANVVRGQLAQAREARDVVKTLCLNDKLSQIDVATRSARERQTSLKSASARAVQTKSPNDVDLASHEFSILTVLKERADQLTAEANQCLGEELAFTGNTQVITQVDPTLPGDDVTAYPPTNGVTVGGIDPSILPKAVTPFK